jgi:thiol-disulfide isomerase/thioredoxin
MIISYFKNSPYITDFKKIDDYEEAIKKSEYKFGFMLIYSTYCGHCRHFAPNYIKLSELFHNDIFFYALSSYTRYSKVFKINGYPTILFYSNNTYNEITSGRSVSHLSQFIRKHIQYNCTEITYDNIDVVYNDVYKKDDRNLIIGYFEPNSKYINSFISTTNNLISENYIDLCFYCTNYKLMINDKDEKYKKLSVFKNISENEVKSYSKNKGNNSFIFNDNKEDNNYEKFLFNNVINLYEDINDKDNIEILEKVKNKAFVFFVYDNENVKKKHIEIIYDLYNMTTDKQDNLFFYFLLNKKIDSTKFTTFQKDKIYLTSNDLKKVMIVDDLNILKNKILENNVKSTNEIVRNINSKLNENDYIIKNNNNSNLSSISVMSNDIEQKDLINENTISKISQNNNNDSNKIQKDDNNKGSNMIDKENNEINSNLSDLADLPEEIDTINIISMDNSSKINNKENIENIIKSKNIINIKKGDIGNNSEKNKNIQNNNTYQEKPIENSNEKKEVHKESNHIIKVLLLLGFIILILYFIITKYLCVGFIKVYDSQIIEFNQPNKIEIV